MNDRFKFRVWDSSANAYIPRSQFILLSDGTLIQEIGGEEVIWESTQPEFCTGLKDKNGKLIYEGDIVRSESYPFKSDNEYHYAAEVCFDEESAVFFYYIFRTSIKVAGRAEGNTGQLNEFDWEIIGNIHEKADLLEIEE